MKYRHKACGTVVAEYLGDGSMSADKSLQSMDWNVLDEPVGRYSINQYLCPVCGEPFSVGSKDLQET